MKEDCTNNNYTMIRFPFFLSGLLPCRCRYSRAIIIIVRFCILFVSMQLLAIWLGRTRIPKQNVERYACQIEFLAYFHILKQIPWASGSKCRLRFRTHFLDSSDMQNQFGLIWEELATLLDRYWLSPTSEHEKLLKDLIEHETTNTKEEKLQ